MTNRVVMCLHNTAWALVRAAHPVPTVAVTALATALGAVFGMAGRQLGTLTAAVLVGQLSVGWLNDLIDRERDRVAGRTDKPLAIGIVSPEMVRLAAALAGAVCVPASLALGLRAGLAHLIAVGSAWAYNAGLKRTVWSWLPYALAFGLLPVAVWWASPLDGAPPWWMIGGASLLGVGAHGANVLPDLADDRATGVSGLPHRLPRGLLGPATAAALLSSLALLILGPAGRLGVVEFATLAAGAALAAVAAGAGGSRLPARLPLVAAAGIAALAIASLLASSAAPVR